MGWGVWRGGVGGVLLTELINVFSLPKKAVTKLVVFELWVFLIRNEKACVGLNPHRHVLQG